MSKIKKKKWIFKKNYFNLILVLNKYKHMRVRIANNIFLKLTVILKTIYFIVFLL